MRVRAARTPPPPPMVHADGSKCLPLEIMARRYRRLQRGFVVLAVVVALAIAGVVKTSHDVSVQSQAGAEQRVTTISQRCDLTRKITDVLRKDDPTRVAAFEVSYGKCLKGQRKAERLAGISALQLESR